MCAFCYVITQANQSRPWAKSRLKGWETDFTPDGRSVWDHFNPSGREMRFTVETMFNYREGACSLSRTKFVYLRDRQSMQ